MIMRNSTYYIKIARELRQENGNQGCLLDYDVHGNRHSSDCPCYKLAIELATNDYVMDMMDKCFRCNGAGYLLQTSIETTDYSSAKKITCPVCNGKKYNED